MLKRVPFTQVSYLEGIANYLGDSAKVYYSPGIPTLDEISKHMEFNSEADGGQKGLKEEIFSNRDLSGQPALVRYDKQVSYTPAREGDHAASDVSIRWTGFFTPSVSGSYLAFVQGPGENGGYRLYIDKKLVLDNWTQWYAFVGEAPITLTQGPHQVELDYYAKSGWGKVTANLGIVRPETLVTPEAKALARARRCGDRRSQASTLPAKEKAAIERSNCFRGRTSLSTKLLPRIKKPSWS